MASEIINKCDQCGKVVEDFAAELSIRLEENGELANCETESREYCKDCFASIRESLIPLPQLV